MGDWLSKKKEDIAVAEKDRSEKFTRTLGNRIVLLSRQRKRDDLCHSYSTLADWSEAISSTFGNQSVNAWIPIDAELMVAVSQL